MILKLAEQDLVDARDLLTLARHVLVVDLANPAYVSTDDNLCLSLFHVSLNVLAVDLFQTLSVESIFVGFKAIKMVFYQFF